MLGYFLANKHKHNSPTPFLPCTDLLRKKMRKGVRKKPTLWALKETPFHVAPSPLGTECSNAGPAQPC